MIFLVPKFNQIAFPYPFLFPLTKEPHLSVFNAIYNEEICPICQNKNRNHKIILVDTVEYLLKNSIDEKYEGAMESAKKDNEWLLLPFDPLGKGMQRSARIPRADFWHAEHYNVLGEKRPQLNSL